MDNTVSHFFLKFNSDRVEPVQLHIEEPEMSSMPRCQAAAAIGAIVALIGTGCSSEGPSKGQQVYPVEGVVKHKGQPVAGADIVFSVKDGSSSSFGRTDASGHYKLTTRKSNDGAPAGDYLVAITKSEEVPQSATKVIPQEDPNYNPFVGKAGPAQPPPKPGLPIQYADTKTSGLTARVNAEKNSIDFDLK